jgi:hypothetical protein
MTYNIQPHQRKEGNHESFTGRSIVSGVSQIEFQTEHHTRVCKAIQWQTILDNKELDSLREIAQNEGLTRARVTQIMNPLKLLPELFIKCLDRIIEMVGI